MKCDSQHRILQELLRSGRKELIFPLTGRGFCSEINYLLIAILYCLTHDLKLKLNTSRWNVSHHSGWTEYFVPFCELDDLYYPNPTLTTYRIRFQTLRLLIRRITSNKIYGHEIWHQLNSDKFLTSRFAIPEIGIDGNIFHSLSKLLKLIFRYNEQTNQFIENQNELLQINKSPYIGIHIRRGDKVIPAANGYCDANIIPIKEYVDFVKKLSLGLNNIYIATDDYSAISEFRDLSPSSWTIYSLCDENSIGHEQRQFNALPDAIKNFKVRILITELEYLSQAEAFIGTYSSNIGRFTCLYRQNESCYSLDNEWGPR